MATVDLTMLTRGEVRMLTGLPRGLSARDHFELDRLDQLGEPIVIVAPEDLDTVTPSFVQGFLARSLITLGTGGFMAKFDLSKLDGLIAADFRIGMERLVRRKSAAALERAAVH